MDKDATTNAVSIYIMTLGVLESYRRLDVGKKLLAYVLDKVVDKHPEAIDVRLHVQVGNDAAVEFYKNAGFTVGDKVANYYSKVEPADAYLVYKSLKDKKTDENVDEID